MLDFIEILGGVPLRGSVRASGAKNGALPLLIASLLTSEAVRFRNLPNIDDLPLLLHLLEELGAEYTHSGTEATVCVRALRSTEASYSLVRSLRASFWVLAPLLARGRAARVALPGGDIIGARPVDIHLDGLARMGAEISVRHGVVHATAPHGLRPANLELRYPSVGATHQLMMAAALTPGTSVIRGAAREPEVAALAEMLTTMGAPVEGAGTSELTVRGAADLGGGEIEVLGDRVEAFTYLLAAAITGGRITVEGFNPATLGSALELLAEIGLEITNGADSLTVSRTGTLRPVTLETGPFPEIATDFQAPLIAALCVAEGESRVEETVFEGRFGHVSELCRMGARIQVIERTAVVSGPARLSGAPVEANDIRAAAALVLAGLAADGVTRIHEPHHLRRGYDAMESKLRALGARIGFRISDPEDYLVSGC